MKFLRGLLKFFTVILAIILSVALFVTQIVFMTLQSASFIRSKDTLIEIFQYIDLSSIFSYSESTPLVIEVPETHFLADGNDNVSGPMTAGAEETVDTNAIQQIIESFTKGFEEMDADQQAKFEKELENLDVDAIVEGLTGEKIDENASEDQVMGKLYASLTTLESVQNVVAELGANALENILNDSTTDVLSEETISSLFTDISKEIKDKTGVELPSALVDVCTEVMEENKTTIKDSLNSIVQDDGFLESIIGNTSGDSDSSSGQSTVTKIKKYLSIAKVVFNTSVKLAVLGAVLVIGGIIFLLFFRSKAGLIWDAVVTFFSSTVFLVLGLGLSNITYYTPGEEASTTISGILTVLGTQFIKSAVIGYLVFAALVALFVVLKILKKKKAAKKAASEAPATVVEVSEVNEPSSGTETATEITSEANTEPVTVTEE